MVLRRMAFAPLYYLVDWVDDNPIRTMFGIVAVGALAVLLAPVALGGTAETGGLALDSTTAGVLAETAVERPAYLAAALLGFVVVLFYNG